MDKEEWRDIRGFEGHYSVSNLGRVLSHKGKHSKILKQDLNKAKYLRVRLYLKGKIVRALIHRLVATAFLGHNPKLVVHHKDFIKTNNSLNNLEWCTTSKNNEYTRNRYSEPIKDCPF